MLSEQQRITVELLQKAMKCMLFFKLNNLLFVACLDTQCVPTFS